MKGLLMLAARAKSKGAPADKSGAPSPATPHPAKEESDAGGADAFAREAFGALRDGDEDGFVTAFKGAVRACMNAEDSDEYTEG